MFLEQKDIYISAGVQQQKKEDRDANKN